MTDEAKALVESLRDMPVWPMEEAADRIEALEAALSWALIQLGSETGYNMESPIWHAYDCARSVLNGEK